MTDHSCNFDYCDVYEDFHSMEEVVTEHLRKSSMQNFLYSGGMHLLISKITSDNDICFNWCMAASDFEEVEKILPEMVNELWVKNMWLFFCKWVDQTVQ